MVDKDSGLSIDLYALMLRCHKIAKDKGFHSNDPSSPAIWEDTGIIPRWMALLHSEVSEALEAHRNDNLENFVEELADIQIRLLDTVEALNLPVSFIKAIKAKCAKNEARIKRHGKRY